MNTDGTLRQAEVLAFFEPPEYMAGNNWIALFYGKSARDSLRLGKDILLITGGDNHVQFPGAGGQKGIGGISGRSAKRQDR